MKYIDRFLNSITMYRLVMYGLLALAGLTIGFAAADITDFKATHLLINLAVAVSAAWVSSTAFAWLFKASQNSESAIISGLIVFFIFAPRGDINDILIVALASVIAMASKFLIAPSKRHLLNPVAASAVIIGILEIDQAIWWVARSELVIPMLILGLLILRKLHRFTMFFGFYVAALTSIYFFSLDGNISVSSLLSDSLSVWPILFLGTIMLTEPITTPPHRRLQLLYGITVGLLLGSGISAGPLFMTPEWALITANVLFYFSFLQRRVSLSLKKQVELASSVYGFTFEAEPKFGFKPGQYLELTAPLGRSDSRGSRRSFSIASAPDEADLKLGIRYNEPPSAFKKYMIEMEPGDKLYANHLQGDFTLPKKPGKFVFIAGGIGITPFRSMLADLAIRKAEDWDIVLFYQVSEPDQIAYQKVFEKAAKVGVRTIYVNSSKNVDKNWDGETGFIDETMLKKHLPDILERTFYISGPNAMVEAYSKMLRSSGVSRWRIKHDYFSGY